MEVSGHFHAPAVLIPEKYSPIATGQEGGLPSEPVWSLCRREKDLFTASAGNRTPIVQPVA
jgi:hypothetical protein